MRKRMLAQSLKSTIVLAMVVTLVGLQWSSVHAFQPVIEWIASIDITPSVPKDHFLVMRREMIAQVLLARVNPREVVHIMSIDSDPEHSVKRMGLSKPSGMLSETAAMLAHIQTLKRPDEIAKPRQPRAPREQEMTTNIAGALAYAKRNSQNLAASRKAGAPGPRWVVNLMTDGKPEGPQTKLPPGPWPTEVQVWFWGVESQHEATLQKWATQDMGIPEEQLHIVRFSDWENVANRLYGRQIGRPQPREEVLKHLLGDSISRVAGRP
jgi:hypothetical protein